MVSIALPSVENRVDRVPKPGPVLRERGQRSVAGVGEPVVAPRSRASTQYSTVPRRNWDSPRVAAMLASPGSMRCIAPCAAKQRNTARPPASSPTRMSQRPLESEAERVSTRTPQRTPTHSTAGVSSLVRRHPLMTFFSLTYGLSWALWIPLVLLREAPGPYAFIALLVGSAVPSTVAIVLTAVGFEGATRALASSPADPAGRLALVPGAPRTHGPCRRQHHRL